MFIVATKEKGGTDTSPRLGGAFGVVHGVCRSGCRRPFRHGKMVKSFICTVGSGLERYRFGRTASTVRWPRPLVAWVVGVPIRMRIEVDTFSPLSTEERRGQKNTIY